MLQHLAKLQNLLPHHLLSKLANRLATTKNKLIKNTLIKLFIKKFEVDLSQNELQDPRQYPDFNSFFTRKLSSTARPVLSQANQKTIISPVDGTVLTLGAIQPNNLYQAKNKNYTLTSLLASNDLAELFQNGSYITQYLAPKDYHRVHMPYSGLLQQMIYVPGQLFSVNPVSCAAIDNIFALNERVICLFKTDFGHMAVILVGAMLVGSMATSWHGVITPPHSKHPHKIKTWNYANNPSPIEIKKADELGYFQMGSTVICLFSNKLDLNNKLINQHILFGSEILTDVLSKS